MPDEPSPQSGKPVPDVIGPGLDVLFCGIDPSLMSAERGHHFASPGNRFWPALHLAGLTRRQLPPDEDRELLRSALGVTNLVDRATRRAAELSRDGLRAGAGALAELVSGCRPRILAVLGPVWVAPNPSGLNAHFQLPDLARLYGELRTAAGRPRADDAGAG